MHGRIFDFHPLYAKTIYSLAMSNEEASGHCQISPKEAKLFPVSSRLSNSAGLAHNPCNQKSTWLLPSRKYGFFLYRVPELTILSLGSGCKGRGQKKQVK